MTMYLKGCHRCGGDLFEGSDEYGPYTQCFQCGFLIDKEAPLSPIKRNERARGPRHEYDARKGHVVPFKKASAAVGMN